LISSIALVLAASPMAVASVSIERIGVGNSLDTPYAMNASGLMVGLANITAPPTIGQAAAMSSTVWGGGNGSWTSFAPISSVANGINDAGQIVGGMGVGSGRNIVVHAFEHSSGTTHDLGSLSGDTVANAINNLGQIVGTGKNSGGVNHAFLYTGTPGVNGSMTDLGTFGGVSSGANAINDAGKAVVSWVDSNASGHFGLYDVNTTGLANIDMATVTSINSIGEVAGRVSVSGVDHAARTVGTPGNGGYTVDLGTLQPGFGAIANGIDQAGNVAGTASIDGTQSRAFLYTGMPGAGGHMIDLDAWLDTQDPATGAQWTLLDARDINNSGIVMGRGLYNGSAALFRLDASTALPEPSGIALTAVAAMAWTLRRR
jgi:probable HAF family extracellular repeat protein